MKLKRVGLDLAKQIFQVHGVDEGERTALCKTLKRGRMRQFFSQLEPTLIGMEACGSAHYWARELTALGHTVRLISPQFVKPYVKGNKNDANDAAAICEAVSRPAMRFVTVKSAEQQAMQSVHRVRSRVIRARTALVNEIRGLLAEFGIVINRTGISAVRAALPDILEDGEHALPGSFRTLLDGLQNELIAADARVKALNAQLQRHAETDEQVQRIQQLDGIGPVVASALVAGIGDGRQFKSGRDLSAWLGIVPRQHGSGGKAQLGGISKRGDTYLRTLLIHGARAAVNASVRKTDRRSAWINALAQRRCRNIATVAVANKNARIVWAMLTRGDDYRAPA